MIAFSVFCGLTTLSALVWPELGTVLYVPMVFVVAWEIVHAARRPSTPRPWRLFAWGFICSIAADSISAVSILFGATDSAAGGGSVLLANPVYVAACVMTIAGAFTLEIRRHPRDWRTGLLDAMALIGVLVAAVLVFAAGPIIDSSMTPHARFAMLSYPLLDAVVVGVIAWMFFSSAKPRAKTLLLLCGALALWPFADLMIAMLGAYDAPFIAFIPARIGVVASYVVFAYAVARPDLEAVSEPQPEVVRVSSARSMLLICTLVILPVLLVIAGRYVNSALQWPLVAVVVVVGIATALRFGQLVRELHRAHAELKEAERNLTSTRSELYRRATIDSITGLPNRLTILERLEAELDESGTQWVSVCYIDLDGFKQVNDTYGHEAGDRLLELVAQRLSGTTRGSEAVGRLAGDEFLAIAIAVDSTAGQVLGRRILASFTEPFVLDDGVTLSVGASVGVAAAQPGSPVESLLVKADRAMYRAKTVEGNALVEWTEAIDTPV